MPVVINGTTGITNVNGSAAAPSETGTDTDTGIYYGTNTVGLATNGTAALQIDSSQNVSLTAGLAVAGNNISAVNSMGFRNRIINGDMRIDQRNAGASVTVNTSPVYVVDRFYCDGNSGGIFTAQRSTTAPSGFTNSFILTVTTPRTSSAATDVYGMRQVIEGFNISDLGWGTASAQSVTLSFWVRSSITGTYAASFFNNTFTRSYVATYTINAANTFEQKTITIAGDTTGTWATDNTSGLTVFWDLGSGSNYVGTAGSWAAVGRVRTSGSANWIATNGATFYITGVQLEAGSVATPFERRDYGRELMMCQRYYEKSYSQLTVPGAVSVFGNGVVAPSSALAGSTAGNVGGGNNIPFKVVKRTAPTVVVYDFDGTANAVRVQVTTDAKRTGVTAVANILDTGAFQYMSFDNSSSVAITQGSALVFNWTASAEL